MPSFNDKFIHVGFPAIDLLLIGMGCYNGITLVQLERGAMPNEHVKDVQSAADIVLWTILSTFNPCSFMTRHPGRDGSVLTF